MVAKKKTKKTVKAAVAVKASAADAKCKCGCGCFCWKKILIFVLGVAVGAAACCVVTKGCCKKFRGGFRHEMKFDANGCLDVSKIKNVEKLEMLKAKASNPNCITKDDLIGGEKPIGPKKPRKPRAQQPAI